MPVRRKPIPLLTSPLKGEELGGRATYNTATAAAENNNTFAESRR